MPKSQEIKAKLISKYCPKYTFNKMKYSSKNINGICQEDANIKFSK